jgi:hypothetical protein
MKENLNRIVFDKNKFNSTVDKNFKELSSTPDPSFFDVNLATIEDFFNLYTSLFYDIPKNGDTNSHEYLIKESSEYLGDALLNDNIQALLEEITELRQENLELRQNILDLTNNNSSVKKNFKPKALKKI